MMVQAKPLKSRLVINGRFYYLFHCLAIFKQISEPVSLITAKSSILILKTLMLIKSRSSSIQSIKMRWMPLLTGQINPYRDLTVTTPQKSAQLGLPKDQVKLFDFWWSHNSTFLFGYNPTDSECLTR
ncbi:hypothetical protein FC96_GL002042 [Secundilactobacillus kimchicus JCM 15530]|uniref:Uncharacterized protein n=1 Tax=Secundilactobacillus kimchicus JCM 15530 TaxID=1302272 RepID=A0A0R1HM49_9LACO|nr:hypothetical protein FC96_GL002042 [Secundilactobacillus kimchicus JCM 15530]